MSKTLEFVKMIAAGENVQAETAFDAMMLARVGSRVEQEKPVVAAGMFEEQVNEELKHVASHGDITVHSHDHDSDGSAITVKHKTKGKIATGDYDRGAGTFFVGGKNFKSGSEVAKHFSGVKEETILEDDMDLWAPDKKKKKKKKNGLGGGDGKIWDTKKPKPSAIGGGSDRKIWEK